MLLGAAVAHADTIPLADTWTFFDPEGQSSLANESSTGFDLHHSNDAGTAQDPATVMPVTLVHKGFEYEPEMFGVSVAAPGHGVTLGNKVFLMGTSEPGYNSGGSWIVSFVTDENTFEIDAIPNTVDGTGGTFAKALPSTTGLYPRVYQVHAPVDVSQIGSVVTGLTSRGARRSAAGFRC